MANSAIAKLHEETTAIIENLADEPYERFVSLVELRERALIELQEYSVVDEHDRILIREFMVHDGRIMKRMQELKEEAGERIGKIQSSKMQKRVYDNDALEGGFFFDKRK